jgi:hypothetical protein
MAGSYTARKQKEVRNFFAEQKGSFLIEKDIKVLILSINTTIMGRKTIFAKNNVTPKQLEKLIDQYFAAGNEKVFYVTSGGKTIEKKMRVFSFTGLCLHLGFCSRASFFDWENRRDENPYSSLLKRARLRIESYYEELIQGGSYVGGIFALKNIGWSDQVTVDNKSTDGTMTPRPQIISMSRDEKGSKEAEIATNRLFDRN